ncbi:glycosyltransferase family 2 protein [Flavobacterium nackdongense]|uniref:Glycosyltransferase family 2 protein n=1 Tax=Flavobacterium nackdongense TaxID=2547394 RepID=A0A4V1AH26_9FLAO|nr:glycosyltransferase family 2 protein [Flavobacterium nackdongense]QBN20072.1 glycosyltransferase family 2 protein [Flavobacterium nackdongense]
MLSILIPTYNYNVVPLVLELRKQCLECEIEFEILVLDDASTDCLKENQIINNWENCHFNTESKNSGRTYTRNKLAHQARFEWLLFLDADVIPVNSSFILSYLESIKPENQVILGGYCYENSKHNSPNILRYKYGKEREEKTASERNQNPYQYVFSGNILIQKKTFLTTNYANENSFYGMDIFFAYQLFTHKIDVFHIENPIYHLGLDTNEIFFAKSLKAVESRKYFLIEGEKIELISPLIKQYKTLKKYGLLSLTKHIFSISEPILKKLILNKNPNLICFDLYRLGYFCTLK